MVAKAVEERDATKKLFECYVQGKGKSGAYTCLDIITSLLPIMTIYPSTFGGTSAVEFAIQFLAKRPELKPAFFTHIEEIQRINSYAQATEGNRWRESWRSMSTRP